MMGRIVSLYVLLCVVSGTAAAEPPWRPEPYAVHCDDEALHALLRGFAASQGLPLDIAAAVPQHRISGTFPPRAPRQFLETLTALFDLGWFYDGSRLHVFPLTDVAGEIVALNRVPSGRLEQALAAIGVGGHIRWRSLGGDGTVYLSGPALFRTLAKRTIDTLNDELAAVAAPAGERIYHWVDEQGVLHYSSSHPDAPSTLQAVGTSPRSRSGAAGALAQSRPATEARP
ncbi:DUF4124 domain-containing protein [uncultured Thiohalocapsa sp.]|uniref:DUF4124 domain-containing protein n=1 Tax=uncultured Thiohalocapsa sp. TaxID=768990 RepID=UPI0025FF96C6|nr:DUF4124 domain-containing protein [uncultured Thiohalocapsa sp.]